MSSAAKLLHVLSLGLYLYVTYFLQLRDVEGKKSNEDPTIRTMTSLSKRFLTNWTYGVQTIYLTLMVFAHFLNIFRFGQKSASKLYSVADYLFTSVATPMAFLVSIVFWVLFTIDRELVFPKVLDMVIPVWVNHSIHTFNSLIAIVDMALVNHKFSSWTSSLKGTFTYLALYAVCLYGTYFQTGIWLYPVLKEMDWPMRFAFSLSNLFIAVFMFALTKGVHKVFWGSVAPEKTKRSGKQKKK